MFLIIHDIFGDKFVKELSIKDIRNFFVGENSRNHIIDLKNKKRLIGVEFTKKGREICLKNYDWDKKLRLNNIEELTWMSEKIKIEG